MLPHGVELCGLRPGLTVCELRPDRSKTRYPTLPPLVAMAPSFYVALPFTAPRSAAPCLVPPRAVAQVGGGGGGVFGGRTPSSSAASASWAAALPRLRRRRRLGRQRQLPRVQPAGLLRSLGGLAVPGRPLAFSRRRLRDLRRTYVHSPPLPVRLPRLRGPWFGTLRGDSLAC